MQNKVEPYIQFIIVTYKPKLEIINEAVSILKEWPVLIVDNKSSDNDRIILQKIIRLHKTECLFNNKNLGYAGGANEGIKHIYHQNIRWVVILNQDLEFSKTAIIDFCTKLSGLKPAVAGPFGGSLDKKRWTTIYPLNDTEKVDYISGSFFAIHRDLLDKVGYLYDPYFMYYEDVDYSIAARRHGFPTIRVRTNEIRHGNTPVLGMYSFLLQYYLARNHLLFIERHAPHNIKLREYLRLPKTILDHYRKEENGAVRGIRDYITRDFGQFTDI